jgi:hypothetical protein
MIMNQVLVPIGHCMVIDYSSKVLSMNQVLVPIGHCLVIDYSSLVMNINQVLCLLVIAWTRLLVPICPCAGTD